MKLVSNQFELIKRYNFFKWIVWLNGYTQRRKDKKIVTERSKDS